MSRKEVLKNTKKIARRIGKSYKPEQIILFGSYAWGRPNRDSDIDLFITTKKKTDYLLDQQKIRKVIAGEMPIDILLYSQPQIKKRLKQGDFFLRDIFDRGIVLYEKKEKK